MNESATNRPRVAYLDGLRGIAALMVVLCHLGSAFAPAIVFGTAAGGLGHALYGVPVLNVGLQGNFMVCVFYVLSGFALSYATLSRGGWSSAVSGLVRRYPRLVVPVFSATMIAAVMLKLSLFPVRKAAALSHSAWLAAEWNFHPSISGAVREGAVNAFRAGGVSYDPPLWTMHNELIGSLIVFAVLILAPRRWMRLVAYAGLAVLTYHSYLLAFVAGMAICEATLAARDGQLTLGRRHLWWIVPAGIYGLVLGSFPNPSPTMPALYDHLLPHVFGRTEVSQQIGANVLGAILVVLVLVTVAPLQTVLETRPMRFLGRISFALYVLHFLVMGSIGTALLVALHGPLPYVVAALAASIAVLAVSIAAAWAFTRLVDEPAVVITKRTYQWLTKGVPFLAAARAPATPPTVTPPTVAMESAP